MEPLYIFNQELWKQALDQPILVTAPLSAADAYWHACTGTPYEPVAVPLRVDRDAPGDTIYFLSPRRDDDTDDSWARRQGVIRDVR